MNRFERVGARLALLVACVLLVSARLESVAWAAEGERAPLLAPLSNGETVELPEVEAGMPSPADFLGYPLGERFTRWAEIRGYLGELAARSERVATWDYGTTYLGRPLSLVAVSSAANIARLDEIRNQRGRLTAAAGATGDERERLAESAPAVVWLAYGVHGNEAASSEAAMAAAYLLAAARGEEWERLLDGVVVLIDPLSNPDGRERYVQAYQERRGARPDPDPDAAEHHEPWPGGRYNHYLADLNRDWTWATQRETEARIAAVRAWEPQVYVDFHEMASEATYFFPPPADPVNPGIDPRVVRWLDAFGRGNAAAFDRLGWLYYKAESYDLFYPGYADSYSSFRGAVGMTYEVGGGGRAGLVVRRSDGSLLSLADRVARHLVTSLATVRTAAADKRRLLADFLAARADAVRRGGTVYLWPGDAPEAAAMAELLTRHGIEVRRLAAEQTLAARELAGGGSSASDNRHPVDHRFAAGTWVVSAAQPLGNLARALLEPETPMSGDFLDAQRRRVEQDLDAGFYDVTAWSLPLAYNVPTWAASTLPQPLGPLVETGPGAGATAGAAATEATEAADSRIGWLLPPAGLATYRAAARLEAAEVRFRVLLGELTLAGRHYPSGTLFVPRLGSPAATRPLLAAAAGDGQQVVAVGSAYSSQGISLGSERSASIGAMHVGLVGGDGVSPTSYGALWHLFDQQIDLRYTRLDASALSDADLAGLDVLVLPDGDGYERALGETGGEAVERWLRSGGLLVALEGAIGWLRDRGLTSIAEWQPIPPAERSGGTPATEPTDPESPGEPAAEVAPSSPPIERPLDVPGAVVATALRPGHPLTAGLAAPPPTMFTGSHPLLASGDPQTDVVTVVAQDPVIAGFAWPESKERLAGSLLVGTETVDRGRLVLFAQDPVFRNFWRGTMPLLLNTVLYGPALLAAGD